MKYLILGGGIAAASAARSIRSHDPEGAIQVVSEEQPGFYFRPLIPMFVEGLRNQNDLLPEDDLGRTCEAQVIYDRAVALLGESKRVQLKSGEAISFDRLLVATGSEPAIPDIPGKDVKRVFTFRTIKDAVSVQEAAKQSQSAIVVGGGLVGIKAADVLRKLGLKVVVVEQRSHILPQTIDSECAGLIASRLVQDGIEILLNETITEILSDGRGVRLDSGKCIEGDFVVMATGTHPNCEWARDSGLNMNKGILVDEMLGTNILDVFAAGDVVEITNPITGKSEVSGLWTNAVEMGKVAGANMAGRNSKYSGYLSIMNSMEIEGIPMVSVGAVHESSGQSEVFIYRDSDHYTKLVFNDDRLIGAICLGDIKNVGIYTNLIRSQRPLGKLKDLAMRNRLNCVDVMFGR
jgi:NAD(P)H-nitrite reductase large subunit